MHGLETIIRLNRSEGPWAPPAPHPQAPPTPPQEKPVIDDSQVAGHLVVAREALSDPHLISYSAQLSHQDREELYQFFIILGSCFIALKTRGTLPLEEVAACLSRRLDDSEGLLGGSSNESSRS